MSRSSIYEELERTQHYGAVGGRTYKRSYWVAHMERKRIE
jgi:hypothetical protein